jgi:uncharacterized protein (TIGR02679 family)
MTDGVPALDRVLLEARRARERRGREGDATVRVGPLTEDEARELDALLAAAGRRRRVLSGHTVTVPLSRLEAGLQAIGHEPASVYAALDPSRPVRDRPAERRADARRREEFWAWLLTHPVVAASPPLQAWLDAARLSGAVRATERATLERALRVVAALPRAARCDRAVLSAELFGEAHALDDGERVGHLACALLKAAAELSDETPARAVWEYAGVLCDTTSSTVLTLGLVPTGGGPLATALRALCGSHIVLTLGQLQAAALKWPVGGTCHSCENPAVLRAAERRLGAACPPLVCTEGWPSDAAALLLRALRDAGWRIRHHGDFDLGGAAIMRHLAAELGAEPWRFAAEDYERALAAAEPRGLPMVPRGGASGSAVRARAVDALECRIRERRAVVCEELLIDELLDDLAATMSS